MFSHSLFRGRRSSRMQRCREFPTVRRRLRRGQLPLRAPCPVPCRGQRMLRPALLRQKPPPRHLFNEQPKKKRSTGKTVGIAVAVLAVVAVLCVAGYFVYTTFFSTSPEEIIAADLEEHLSFYEDPEEARVIACFPRPIASFPAWC